MRFLTLILITTITSIAVALSCAPGGSTATETTEITVSITDLNGNFETNWRIQAQITVDNGDTELGGGTYETDLTDVTVSPSQTLNAFTGNTPFVVGTEVTCRIMVNDKTIGNSQYEYTTAEPFYTTSFTVSKNHELNISAADFSTGTCDICPLDAI
jgi:hypothetical protein